MSIKFTTVPAKSLYQPILSTDVTFKLADITGFDGADLTSASFGTVGYGVFLNSDRSVMELFSWDPTTIASVSISIVDRGLPFTGSGAGVTANKLDWPAGSTVLLGSDTPQFIQWLKDYIDGIAIAGSPDASTTAKGIVEEATQAEADAGTAAGGTGARLFSNPSTRRGKLINDYAVDSAGSDAYAITTVPAITAYAVGQRFTFKAGIANTGAATLNVCGLGAKTIKKATTVVTTDLSTGDILVNQIVEVEYDGTNMQLLSKTPLLAADLIGTLPLASEATTRVRSYVYSSNKADTAATATISITHGLGTYPTYVRMTAMYQAAWNNQAGIGSGDSFGIAKIDTSQVVTYSGMMTFILSNGNASGSGPQYRQSLDGVGLMFMTSDGSNGQTATISNITPTNIDLVITKNGSGLSGGSSSQNIYYVVEIFY